MSKFMLKSGLTTYQSYKNPFKVCHDINPEVVYFATMTGVFASPVMQSEKVDHSITNLFGSDNSSGEFEIHPIRGRKLSFDSFSRGSSNVLGIPDLTAIRGNALVRSTDVSELQLTLLDSALQTDKGKTMTLTNANGSLTFRSWFNLTLGVEKDLRTRLSTRDEFIAYMQKLSNGVVGKEGDCTIVLYAHTSLDLLIYFFTTEGS